MNAESRTPTLANTHRPSRLLPRALLVVVTLAVVALVQLATATTAGADTVCKDGTHTESYGQGACSGHGGVEYWIDGHEPDGTPIRSYPPAEGGGSSWLVTAAAIAAVGVIVYVFTRPKRTRRTDDRYAGPI